MSWTSILIGFVLGAFLGPMLLSMLGGLRGSSSSGA